MEQDKKLRREIANSNERRRMQSINAGFNSLRTMLPKNDGEKLSKAAILQHTAEYIHQLEEHKTRLMQEIDELKKLVNPELLPAKFEHSAISQPVYKRVKMEPSSEDVSNSDSSDEGIQCNPSPKNLNNKDRNTTNNKNSSGNENGGIENQLTSNNCITNGATPVNGDLEQESLNVDELRTELIKVRKILDKERKLRMQLEEKVRALESQLYPTRIKEITHQVQLQFQTSDKNDLEQNYYTIQEDETMAAASSLVVDNEQEVIAETIEIETHSCPGSPNAAALFASTQQPIISPIHYSSQLVNDDGTNGNHSTTTLLIQSGMEDPCEYMSDGETQDALIEENPQNLTAKELSSIDSSPDGGSLTLRLLERVESAPKVKTDSVGVENGKKASKSEKPSKKLKTNPPAAIALPIDMPFICESEPTTEEIVTHCEDSITTTTEVSVNQLGEVIGESDEINGIPTTVTLQIVSDGSVYEAGSSAGNSGRNLDTIVEAIRHLEGDHLFRDVSGRQTDQAKMVTEDGKGTSTTTVVLKQVNDRELSNLIAAGQSGTYQLTTSSNGEIRTVLLDNNLLDTITPRPGVIVSNHL